MIREQRLDPVVHYLEVRGAQPVDELSARFDAALAASVDQALTILKLLCPKTAIQAPRIWVTPLSLPRVDPA